MHANLNAQNQLLFVAFMQITVETLRKHAHGIYRDFFQVKKMKILLEKFCLFLLKT